MKLYYSKGACSLAVRIIINELNINCQYEAVDLKTKQTETNGNFLTINPKGAVPTLVLDNNDVLTENAVIQQYLADTHKAIQLLPAIGNIKRYHVLEWLNFVSTDLHKNCAPLFNPNVPAAIKDDIFKPILKNKLPFVNQQLSDKKFLAGDEFTLPDGYLFVVLRWLPSFQIHVSDWPHLARFVNEARQYPAIQKSLMEEGLARP